MRFGLMARLDNAPLNVIFGGDGRPIDQDVKSSYDVLAKMHILNETENSVTLFTFECYALLKKKSRWRKREKVKFQYANRLANYDIPDSDKVDELREKLTGVALERAIGHTGWISFTGELASKDATGLGFRIEAIDSLGHRHRVTIDQRFIQDDDMRISAIPASIK
jgi:hypothetical protein